MTDGASPGPNGTGTGRQRPSAQHRSWRRLAVAAGLVGLGLFFVIEAAAIRVLPSYARVGPRAFPYLVAGGLLVLGAALAWRAWRGLDSDADPAGDEPPDRLGLALVAGGLVLQSLLISHVGFVVAATLTFVLTTAGFGSRHVLRDAAIGLALAVISYVGFTRGLGLTLPAGFLEGLL